MLTFYMHIFIKVRQVVVQGQRDTFYFNVLFCKPLFLCFIQVKYLIKLQINRILLPLYT